MPKQAAPDQARTIKKDANLTIPCIQEEIEISRVPVVTGNVSIRKLVSEHETLVDEALSIGTVEVERVVFNVPLDSPAAIRREGDVTIFPVMEEVVTVTKQLILKEEIRVTQSVRQTHSPQRIILRKEEIVVEREKSAADSNPMKGSTGQ